MTMPKIVGRLSAVIGIALFASTANAAPPPADTVIGNQAAATYESGGRSFSVQSNVVETVINEVYGIDIEADQTKSGAPGGFVFFPHIVTNNGNTEDVINLATDQAGGAGPDDFTFSSLVIYADIDEDGVPDNLTEIIATPALASGGTFGIVVRAQLPATVTNGESSDFSITATSQGDNTQTDVNVDTVTSTTGSVMDLIKNQTLQNDADGDGVFSQGDTVRVTFTYQNNGIADATDVLITDLLPAQNVDGAPITLTYVAGSGRWSDSGALALTDVNSDPGEQTNGQGHSISYDFDDTTPNTVTAGIDVVPAGRSGTLTFDYVITAAPGGTFINFGTVSANGDGPTDSNDSLITIGSTFDLTIADAEALTPSAIGDAVGDDDGTNLGGITSGTDDDATLNDIVDESTDVFPGQSLAFAFVVTNHSDATDTITLNVANNSFPNGTVFDLVGADGVAPLVGNTITLPASDGAPGGDDVEVIQVIARLPLTTPVTAAPANFDAVITASSSNSPGTTNAAQLLFSGAVLAPPVDLENTVCTGAAPCATGNGNVDNGGSPWNTVAVSPGDTAVFGLRVTVEAGAPANAFDLQASTDQTFGSTTLPAGWIVEFFDTSGNQMTSTGTLSPTPGSSASIDFEARVTVPASAAALPSQNVYFRAVSPTNGASDVKLDAVTVNEIADVSIQGDVSVQAAPGGIVVISHTITNNGNSTVTGGAISISGTGPAGNETDGLSDDPFTDGGMAAALYYDANNDGVLDAADPLIADISQIPGGLAPGGQARVFVRVQVPSTASTGLIETGDVAVGVSLTTASGTVTDSVPANNEVTDTVTVVSGDVALLKEQALDVACDGTADGAFTVVTQNAEPGYCVAYRITAENTGSDDAENVVIYETTPDFTTYATCGGACGAEYSVNGGAGTAVSVAPADGGTGAITTTAPNAGFILAPGGRAILTFTVRIDN